MNKWRHLKIELEISNSPASGFFVIPLLATKCDRGQYSDFSSNSGQLAHRLCELRQVRRRRAAIFALCFCGGGGRVELPPLISSLGRVQLRRGLGLRLHACKDGIRRMCSQGWGWLNLYARLRGTISKAAFFKSREFETSSLDRKPTKI